jgi:GNAT superfamily N-acetyltransferase
MAMDTTMEYEYRAASTEDVDEIRELTLIAYGQFDAILTEENRNAKKQNLGNTETYRNLFGIADCVVCVHENKIVGSAFLIPSGNPNQWFEKDWAYIRLVAVHPDESGKGIGKQLTMWCLEKAKENQEKTIALHTSEFQHAARHIYEGLGFQKQRDLELMFGKQYYLYTLPLTAEKE